MLVERSAVRASDAEREAAASALGDHLVAGRLSVVEYEERVSKAWAATYDRELTELFADLPVPQRAIPVVRRRGPSVFMLAPMVVMMAAVVGFIAVVNVVPWVLFVLLGMFVFSRRRRMRYRYSIAGHSAVARVPAGPAPWHGRSTMMPPRTWRVR
ncbi:hypothetical protein SMNI109538_22400 [Smaragdicoccus niigatensis]